MKKFCLNYGNTFEYFDTRDAAVDRGRDVFSQASARFGDGGSAVLFCGDTILATVTIVEEA